jgi:hypothetical protein
LVIGIIGMQLPKLANHVEYGIDQAQWHDLYRRYLHAVPLTFQSSILPLHHSQKLHATDVDRQESIVIEEHHALPLDVQLLLICDGFHGKVPIKQTQNR